MSTDCCDYGCTRAPNCPAGSVVAEKLLAGEKLPEVMTYDGMDWQTAREAMASRQQQAYERAQAQWFKPLYNTPEPTEEADKPVFTPMGVAEAAAKFALCLCAVALVAIVATWPRLGAVLQHIFN